MWVNYAERHTGFVVGFSGPAPFFTSDNRKIRKVEYQENPPKYDDADEEACFYKSPTWAYEEEWRCVKRFTPGESRIVSFDWPIIKEVIFGHLTASWVIARIVNAVETYSETLEVKPRFLFCEPTHAKWTLINHERVYKSCKHCRGEGYTWNNCGDGS